MAAFEKAYEGNREDFYILIRVPTFFEDMGILVEESALDVGYTRKSWAWVIERLWKLWAPTIARIRQLEEWPSYYEHFEGLKNRILAHRVPDAS